MNSEKWLPVVGYEGLYAVSDSGRVSSVLLGTPFIVLGPEKRGATSNEI